MHSRRDVLRFLTWLGAALVASPVVAGCAQGSDAGSRRRPRSRAGDLARSAKTRREGAVKDRPLAVDAVLSFTADLHQRLAADPGNVVSSPYSVAVALAMSRNGARGQTASEMDDVLHAPELGGLNGGLNALTALIESRAGSRTRADGSKATISLDVANSLWGPHDTAWRLAFLDDLTTHYGAGMHLVDYTEDPESARDLINAWVSKRTHGRIPEILPPGVLDQLVRLVLVNAIYLQAPWERPFQSDLTKVRPFARDDGSRVDVDTMTGMLDRAGYGSGPGWQAARLLYAGGELAMTVILPDHGGLASFEQSLDAARLTEILSSISPVPVLRLQLPRWKFRTQVTLNDHLGALGMPTAFKETQADFSGMTAEEQLFIKAVMHEAFIAVDEKGTEAAAATAVVIGIVSAPAVMPLTVDRPFVFVIHDVETSTPLFIGRVVDPSA